MNRNSTLRLFKLKKNKQVYSMNPMLFVCSIGRGVRTVFFGFPGDVLGVAQLCNKKTGQHFTEFDEDLASAFAVYCCISISHVSASLVIPFNLIHFKSLNQRSMYKFTFYF